MHTTNENEIEQQLEDAELDALLAGLEGPSRQPTFQDLEKNCFGHSVVSTVNARLGRDNCSRCTQRVECYEKLTWFRNDIAAQTCFGKYLIYPRPSFSPTISCKVCSQTIACELTQRFIRDGIGETIPPKQAITADAPVPPPTIEPATEPTAEPAAAEAPIAITAPEQPSGDYAFPIEARDSGLLAKYAAIPTQDLHAKLQVLQKCVEHPSETNYTPHRIEICAISLALNKQGNDMPRFRPGYKGNFKKGGKPRSDQDALIANDRRVIDLDWTAHHRQKVNKGASKNLFLTTGLDFDAASAFVSHRGAADEKIDILGLSLIDQVPLSVLQSSTLSTAWNNIYRHGPRDISRIEDSIAAGHGQRKDAPEWLWMIYVVYRLSGNDVAQTLKLSRHLGQEAPALVKMKRTVTWLSDKAELTM